MAPERNVITHGANVGLTGPQGTAGSPGRVGTTSIPNYVYSSSTSTFPGAQSNSYTLTKALNS